jgi:hypothetical protein
LEDEMDPPAYTKGREREEREREEREAAELGENDEEGVEEVDGESYLLHHAEDFALTLDVRR